MSNRGNKTKTETQLNKLRTRLMMVVMLVVIVMAISLSYIITSRTTSELENRIVDLIATDNEQQVYNVNVYLENVESTASLLFSNDQYCEYDATNPRLDDFDKIQNENAIKQRIQDLGVLENFSDFGIVYANDNTVGWLSNTTQEAFPDGGLYDYLTSHITEEKNESGWFFDYDTSYDRLYYVKKLNPNAVIIAAFYSRELDYAFMLSDSSEDITVRLVDSDGTILYSAIKEEIGTVADYDVDLSQYEGSRFQSRNKDSVIIAESCENGWFVVCTANTDKLFGGTDNIKGFSFAVTIVLVVAVMLVMLLMLSRMYNTRGGVLHEIAENAENDRLTKLTNKISYQELVDGNIREAKPEDIHVMVMLDMDNFKKVNDTFGHNKGDEVLVETSSVFLEVMENEGNIGRIGGDEFSIYIKFSGKEESDVKYYTEDKVRTIFEVFNNRVAKDYESCNLSISAGMYMSVTKDELGYEYMYKKADEALYESKRSGKNQFNWKVEE